MALEDTLERQPDATHKPMRFKGLNGVRGTGGVETAMPAENGGQCALIKADQPDEQPRNHHGAFAISPLLRAR